MKTNKNIIKHRGHIALTLGFLAAIAISVSSCKNEEAEVRPGLYVSSDLIDAFEGKLISVSGQASCYTGLESIKISCEAWKINEHIDLSQQQPVVWNFDYSFEVPSGAKFPQELLIVATDKYGTEMKKSIQMRYAPATTAPYIEGLQRQIAIEYDSLAGQADCILKATLYGEDMLKTAVVTIPAENFSQTYELSKSEEELVFSYIFKARGNYDMTITVTDNSGNQTVAEHKLIVMLPEVLDELKDYPLLYTFKSGENEDDYLFGYYQYVQRKDAYQYQVEVYAETDETAFLFSPTRETNGERLYGESPFVEERIISVQTQPGYVQGYKPGKGYWGIWIDLNQKVIKKWALDVSSAEKAPLYCTADWNGWKFDAMNPSDAPYKQELDITIYKKNQYFCFSPNTDWTRIWRGWDSSDGSFAGWYMDETGEYKGGGTLTDITEDIDATITFDTAIKWSYIIKR